MTLSRSSLKSTALEMGSDISSLMNGERALSFSYQLGDLFLDFSKSHICDEILDHYSDRALELKLEDKKRELFAGYPINVTESRSVLHTLLRGANVDQLDMYNEKDKESASTSQNYFMEKIDEIREKFIETKQPIKNIVHIGIGGSSLGPQLMYEALVGLEQPIKVHFVDNIDAHQILSVLNQCRPETTLVFGVSKTFTTQETLVNIATVKQWYASHSEAGFYDHFFAVTASAKNINAGDYSESETIVFPEWVGGRYSVWSSVSLSVALLLGRDQFKEFLDGAALVDREFSDLPPKDNPIFVAAALDHFYANYGGAASKAIFAYDYRLRTLVAYLQQLEMESNGKDRDLAGKPLTEKSSPVVWGGTGTCMQHSTFQLLHQGTQFIPVEFVLVKKPAHNLENHHSKLLANGLAQSAALLVGRKFEEVSNLPENKHLSDEIKKSKVFAGEKPSTTIVIGELTASSLGQLLSFYEHRVFCNGVLANVNSFDQMGVELGKQLATSIEPFLSHDYGASDSSIALDASTQQLISQLRSD